MSGNEVKCFILGANIFIMDLTRIHLFITHLPLFGLFLGLLALLYGLIVKSRQVKIVSLGIILIATLGGVIAFRTGEPAEESVEHIAGVLHDSIEEHEESAEVTILFLSGLGVLALVALYLEMKDKKAAKQMSLAVLAFSVLTFYFVAQTANLGGKIRHTEILENGIPAHAPSE